MEPSKTIPDQSMTMKQILDRYAKGLPLNGSKDIPLWDSDNQGMEIAPPEWNQMDLSERADWMEKKALEVKAIREKHAKEMQEEQRKKDRQWYRDEFQKELDARKQGSTPAPSAGNDSDLK